MSKLIFTLGLEITKILSRTHNIGDALNDICSKLLNLDDVVSSYFYKTCAIATDIQINSTGNNKKQAVQPNASLGYIKAIANRDAALLIEHQSIDRLLNLAKIWQKIEPTIYKSYLIIPLKLSDESLSLWGFWITDFAKKWSQETSMLWQQTALQIEMQIQFHYSQQHLQKQIQEAEHAYDTLYGWTEQYRHLVEQVPSVSYVLPISSINLGNDDNHQNKGRCDLAYVSPQIYDLLGLSCNHQFFAWQDYMHPEDRSMIYEQLHKTINTGAAFNCEYRLLRPDGTAVWVSDTAQLGLATDQKTLVLRGSVHDISDRKNAEAQLIAAKITESTNQSKSKFLAFMSHEIRTPMNTVIGMTDILLNTNLSLQQQQYVNTIRQGGEILLSIVDNILDFSRIESGHLEIEKQPFVLKECIEQVLTVMRPRAAQKSLRLAWSQSLQVPQQVIGDYGRLRQILINLISNAIKFTEHGEVNIKINAQKLDFDCGYKLLFAVQDTGIGIAPEAIGQIFQSFNQADSSINRQYGGTGLGLTICKQLCELMGGEISVTSHVGEGTTFHFAIAVEASPVEDLSARIYDEQIANLAVAPVLTTNLGDIYPLNILVVEDHPVNREILLLMLEKMGYHADSVDDGIYALEYLQQKSYDLIFMDLQMPIMDGLIATDRIRRSSYPQPWIIGLSANAFQESRDLALQAGMNDYLTKPLQIETLIGVVRRLPKIAQDLQDRELINSICPSENLLPVFDSNILDTLADAIGYDHIPSLIDSFLDLSTTSIANMQAAVQIPDLQVLESENHSLKGGSSTFGASRLHSMCQELHQLCLHAINTQICSTEDMETIQNLVDAIAMEFQLFSQVVRHATCLPCQSSSA
jgi:PAS domain S-box-containing protein